MGLHSTLNFLVMVIMIRPYKKAVERFFLRLFCWHSKQAMSWKSSISEPSTLPQSEPRRDHNNHPCLRKDSGQSQLRKDSGQSQHANQRKDSGQHKALNSHPCSSLNNQRKDSSQSQHKILNNHPCSSLNNQRKDSSQSQHKNLNNGSFSSHGSQPLFSTQNSQPLFSSLNNQNEQRKDSGQCQNKLIERLRTQERQQKMFNQRISVSEIRFHPNF